MRYVSDMTTDRPNTLSALLDKRREIAGRIETAQAQVRVMVADLDALDTVIRLFDADAIPGAPKRFPAFAPAFKREVSRLVRVALRNAPGPLTTREIAVAVAEARGLNASDKETFEAIRGRVGVALKRMKARGAVTAAQVGQSLEWQAA